MEWRIVSNSRARQVRGSGPNLAEFAQIRGAPAWPRVVLCRFLFVGVVAYEFPGIDGAAIADNLEMDVRSS